MHLPVWLSALLPLSPRTPWKGADGWQYLADYIWLGQALLLHPELREGTWADLGTGSGALAIGLASILLPGSRVLAVDCSASARAWANLNVQRLGLAASVQVHACMAMLRLLVTQNIYL